MYMAFAMGSVIAPSVVNKSRPQTVMAIAGLAYSLWMFSGYFATSKTLSDGMVAKSVFVCSFAQGIGASIMWTA